MQLAAPPAAGEPWKIGWFGALRCRKSLELLAAFTRQMDGRFEVVLRGRPAYSEFDDFDGLVAAEPYIRFAGPYRNPEDLAAIYGEVHFSWAIDFFEEGLNSSWLLPNRLYEGCRFGAVPIAMRRPRPDASSPTAISACCSTIRRPMRWPHCSAALTADEYAASSGRRSWRRIAAPGSATSAIAARYDSSHRELWKLLQGFRLEPHQPVGEQPAGG